MVEFADNLLLPTLFFPNRLATGVKITHGLKGLTYFWFSFASIKAKEFLNSYCSDLYVGKDPTQTVHFFSSP